MLKTAVSIYYAKPLPLPAGRFPKPPTLTLHLNLYRSLRSLPATLNLYSWRQGAKKFFHKAVPSGEPVAKLLTIPLQLGIAGPCILRPETL